ncbi:MAG TPA: MurR/RpiR family transcriptional regulator [Burkholderiaceae bacterium]|nr:MurR/RpiR family transcriptional regulator [Burkholderiaceae bacterium]
MAQDHAAVDLLMQRIGAEYATLSKQQKVVAADIERNRATIAVERITDIAGRCGVQPSAVVRFAQRFGFSGFSEMQDVFRANFAAQASAQSYQQRIRQMIDGQSSGLGTTHLVREFVDASRSGLEQLAAELSDAQLDAAVDLLLRAENIYVVGVRRSFPVAAYIAYALQHTGKRVHLVNGLGGMFREQIRSIRAKDAAFAISFAPYGKETQYCVRAAHAHRAKVLLISDTTISPLARYAHAILTVREGTAFAFRSLTSTICLCQALFIALAYRLELQIEEVQVPENYDD